MAITGSYDTLMGQAQSTVEAYFSRAVAMVRDELGDGAVLDNGALIGTLVTAMSQDFHTAVLCKTIGEATDMIQGKSFGGG